MSEPGTVWLVGMMGAGKSTVGPELAARLSRRFVDTDAEIERAAGRSVAEIFAREGEQAFRTLEREEIGRWCGEPVVVALGGGAIAQPGAPERLARAGTVVYLRARPGTLLRRLGDTGSRPLLEGLGPAQRRARIAELLESRRAAYESAALVVDVDERSAAEVVDLLASKLGMGVSA